ncbi:MAG: InlB B-repeat-containing protein [Spirochaetaceae bacterium]|nr:InlB B-repeat-containing protein [Spirochaetaceae bacterium]
MKNTFNRFLCFVVIFGIFVLCGTFTSCENLFGGKAPINYEKAYITITTNLSTNARTVLPSNSFTEDTTGLTWTLTGSLNGGAVQQLKEWRDITEAATTTAYNNMISDTSISLNAGTWTFTLTASNESGKLLEATIEQKINGGENTLDFDMKEAVGEGAASGQIDFTLKWKEQSVVDNVAITLSKRNDSSFKNIEVNYEKSTSFDKDYEYVNFSAGADPTLTPGNYILKLELQQQTGTTEATENSSAEPIYKTINTYTCLIHVAPGLCSEGEETLETLARLYTINYLEEDETEITSFKENSVPTTYNKYTTFALPTPTKDGHIFSGWYEKIDDDTFEKIENTDNFSISTNTNLYAKWNLIETWEDITRAVDCVPSTSLPSQPEFIVTNDLTATSTITISNGITLKALDGADGVTITRGEGFAGAFFDNTSTLTLEGITLDGGKDSNIVATAPLITSSGSLTLNNCTLQNNNNSNATETGTGIFLQINDTSSLCSFNDVSFGGNSSDEIPHIKIENGTSEKFTFNLGGSLEGGVPAIDMPSTTCINISESLTIPNGKSIKITLDEYTIGNRIISTNEGINLVRENFSLTTTEESWFIDSTGYLAKGDLGVEPSTSETGEYVVSSLDNLLWIARGLKTGSITSFNMILTSDIDISNDEWQFYQLNVNNASTIDGQGHSITINVDVSEFGNNAGGLFYKFNNSTVKNLVLKGRIKADTTEVGYIGALCRSAYRTTIQNVMSTVEIIDNGSGNAGGLVGYFGGNKGDDGDAAHIPGSFIQNCAVYANIKSTNGTVGGLVGCTWSGYRCWQINNCIYAGTVTGGTDQGVGAIIGTHQTGRTSTFKDTWYCANGTSEIVGKYNNEENGENFDGYEDTVISKTADQIATAEAATLLNTNSDGTLNNAWEYVEGKAYPTLKIVN